MNFLAWSNRGWIKTLIDALSNHTHCNLVEIVLEVLVVLPQTFHILHRNLNSLLVHSSHRVHLLLLLPSRVCLLPDCVSTV